MLSVVGSWDCVNPFQRPHKPPIESAETEQDAQGLSHTLCTCRSDRLAASPACFALTIRRPNISPPKVRAQDHQVLCFKGFGRALGGLWEGYVWATDRTSSEKNHMSNEKNLERRKALE